MEYSFPYSGRSRGGGFRCDGGVVVDNDRDGLAFLDHTELAPDLSFNALIGLEVVDGLRKLLVASRDSGELLSIRQMIEAFVVAHGLDRKRRRKTMESRKSVKGE